MTFPPYQPQDPRQRVLQRQIEQSRQDGDHERLRRLELLWVHRFGVTSLPRAEQPAADVDGEHLDTPSSIGRFTALLRNSPDELARTFDETSEGVSSGHRDSPVQAPVPMTSPERLRRWLTPVTNDEFPKAS